MHVVVQKIFGYYKNFTTSNFGFGVLKITDESHFMRAKEAYLHRVGEKKGFYILMIYGEGCHFSTIYDNRLIALGRKQG